MWDKVVAICDDILQNKSDPRVSDLFLMKSPGPMILLSLGFIVIVKIIGPKLMENRKPFKLNNTIMIYNIVQILISSYIFYESCVVWFSNYEYRKCNSIDYSNSPDARRNLFVLYLYFLSKYPEFLDTFFFVLRKKYTQVTFLHLYHHASMPVWSWVVIKFYAGGSLTLPLVLNTFVHIIMYSYYLVSAMGPQYQKYLWWKKYLTSLQLVQFVTGILHFAFAMLSSECNIPRTFFLIYMGNAILLFKLFSDFYKEQYKKKQMIKKTSNEKAEVSQELKIQGTHSELVNKTEFSTPPVTGLRIRIFM